VKAAFRRERQLWARRGSGFRVTSSPVSDTHLLSISGELVGRALFLTMPCSYHVSEALYVGEVGGREENLS